MRPYFERDGITIYHADCRDVLPTLEAGSVDLLVTDPPYGVGWESGYRAESFGPIVGDADQSTALAALSLAVPLVRDFRHVYIFGRFDLSALPLCSAVELIWDKVNANAGDLTLPWGNQHEYIQFAVHVPSRANRKSGRGNATARLRRGSVLSYLRPTASAVTRHPTEKPVPLLRELIESSSRFGETVLDPFMGVGSTLVAAELEGRRAIGIEIEERYCEIAAKRLSQLVLPMEAHP